VREHGVVDTAGVEHEVDVITCTGFRWWTRGGCTSWYLDAKCVNRILWLRFTGRYWLATRRVRPADFELIGDAGDN
jgi:hypothetical protein